MHPVWPKMRIFNERFGQKKIFEARFEDARFTPARRRTLSLNWLGSKSLGPIEDVSPYGRARQPIAAHRNCCRVLNR
jgi:hypothetical protein